MSLIYRSVLLLSGLFFAMIARSQEFHPAFRSYGINEGLSQSVVTSIFQDSKGFIWLGTEDGLNKFDGYNFKIFRYSPDDSTSISDNWVLHLAMEDHEGDIWMVTSDRNINVFNPRQESFYKIKPAHDKGSLPVFKRLFFIFQDNNGIIWVSTDQGLFCIDKKSWKISEVWRNTNKEHPRFFYSFLEDAHQHLWFGSNQGFVVYDTKLRKITGDYFHGDDPAKTTVLGFKTDDHQNVWVVTSEQVLCYRNSSQFSKIFTLGGGRKSVNVSKEDKPKIKIFPAVFMDKSSCLWIFSSQGLVKFDTKSCMSKVFTFSPSDPTTISSNELSAFYEDKVGNIWIGTENGLNKYIPETDHFNRYYSKSAIANHGIYKIFEDRNGKIWTLDYSFQAEGSHLGYLDEKKDEIVYLPSSQNGKENITLEQLFVPFSDQLGNIWFGTYGAGVIEYIPYQKKFELIRNMPGSVQSIAGNSTWAISEDKDGRLWLALFQDGLDCYNPANGKVDHYKEKISRLLGTKDFSILSVVCDPNGKVWINVMRKGLISMDMRSGALVFYNDQPGSKHHIHGSNIISTTLDLHGNILVCYGDQGLDILNPYTGQVRNFVHSTNDPNSLYTNNTRYAIQASDGKYWVSTDGAITIIDPVTFKMQHFISKKNGGNGILVEKAGCIFEDAEHHIWIGTHGGGLALFDREKQKFQYWDEKKGLANNVIYGILEDDEHKLWLSTNHGISCFNPSTASFLNYDVKDGLQGSEFNANSFTKTRNGKLYFGGINGITGFYPSDIQADHQPPRISITGFQIFNKHVEVLPADKRFLIKDDFADKIIWIGDKCYLPEHITYTRNIQLDYQQKVFTFEFAALKFDMPERCTYKYRMEGFETEWNIAGHRRYATYTNLPPGNYIFRVTAANADGIWNPQAACIHIIIHPPFYQTWWFITLILGLIIFLLTAFVMQREKNLKQTRKVLENKVQQRTRELNDKNEELTLRNIQILKQKEEIASQASKLKVDMDIQHQSSELALLRTQVNPHFLFNTLNNIYSLVYQKAPEAPESVMKLSDIMRYMLYETGSDKVLLEKEIRYLQSFVDLQLLRIRNRGFVKFDIQGDPAGITIAPMLLIPFVENAFKHGNKLSTLPGITILLSCSPSQIEFSVRNSKKRGGAKDSVGGIGLTNVKRRLELIYYDKYSLDIREEDDIFEVNLTIKET